MRVISIKKIRNFWEDKKYSDSEQALRAWYWEMKKEKWQSPNDVKRKYKNASIIGHERIVFNVKGNKYRLIVVIKYKFQIIFIRFVGTHDEYDKINARNI